MGEFFIVPSPRDDMYVELAKTSSGTLYRKQILKRGQKFKHPKNPNKIIEVTDEMMASLERNFNSGVAPIVQFPACDANNKHSEAVLDNLGEVIDVEVNEDGVDAIIDVRRHADDVGETILGASAFFSLDYEDNETGEHVGPTLLHVAATNRPYLTNLRPYEAIAASASSEDDEVFMLSDESGSADTGNEIDLSLEEPMDLDQLLAELRSKYNIDVPALQSAAQELASAQAQLSSVQLSASDGTTITLTDVGEALIELSGTVRELSSTVQSQERALQEQTETNIALTRERAEAEVDTLIGEGRILPFQRDDMVELSLEDRERFERLVPADSIVELSERGVLYHEEPAKAEAHQATISRYVDMHAKSHAGRARASKSR